jgi:hypothetical protein
MPDKTRLPHLLLEAYREHYEHTRRHVSEFQPRTQACWYSHANELILLAKLAHAIGRPLSEVRATLRESLPAFAELFSLRGKSPYLQTRYKDGVPLPQEQVFHDGYTSVDSFHAALVALITEDIARARALVELAGHSPGAEYVSPQSEVCTSNQQTLSHALNAVLAQDMDGARRETQKLAARRGNQLEQQIAATIAAIADARDVRTELDALLFYHAKLAKRGNSHPNASLLLCLPALGLASLAVQLGQLQHSDLDADNLYAPWGLLREG